MTKIDIDTIKIKCAAEEIEKLANEYNLEIEKIFLELQNLNKTGAWVGTSENSSINIYINSINKEKKQYTDLAFNIKQMGTSLKEYSNELENISNIKIEER